MREAHSLVAQMIDSYLGETHELDEKIADALRILQESHDVRGPSGDEVDASDEAEPKAQEKYRDAFCPCVYGTARFQQFKRFMMGLDPANMSIPEGFCSACLGSGLKLARPTTECLMTCPECEHSRRAHDVKGCSMSGCVCKCNSYGVVVS
jgi:hypothetical protein